MGNKSGVIPKGRKRFTVTLPESLMEKFMGGKKSAKALSEFVEAALCVSLEVEYRVRRQVKRPANVRTPVEKAGPTDQAKTISKEVPLKIVNTPRDVAKVVSEIRQQKTTDDLDGIEIVRTDYAFGRKRIWYKDGTFEFQG
jgi:hypothetical protein